MIVHSVAECQASGRDSSVRLHRTAGFRHRLDALRQEGSRDVTSFALTRKHGEHVVCPTGWGEQLRLRVLVWDASQSSIHSVRDYEVPVCWM